MFAALPAQQPPTHTPQMLTCRARGQGDVLRYGPCHTSLLACDARSNAKGQGGDLEAGVGEAPESGGAGAALATRGRVGRYRADPQSCSGEPRVRGAKVQSQDFSCGQQPKKNWGSTQVRPALERQTERDGKSHTGHRAGPRHEEGALGSALTLPPQGRQQDPGTRSGGQHSKPFQTFLHTQTQSPEDRAVPSRAMCWGHTVGGAEEN